MKNGNENNSKHQVGDVVQTKDGQRWEIISLDSDPTASIWVVDINDRDRDAFIFPSAIVERISR